MGCPLPNVLAPQAAKAATGRGGRGALCLMFLRPRPPKAAASRGGWGALCLMFLRPRSRGCGRKYLAAAASSFLRSAAPGRHRHEGSGCPLLG